MYSIIEVCQKKKDIGDRYIIGTPKQYLFVFPYDYTNI